ncbi:MAG TPA: amidohydrolase family protein, partial [Gemmataceae bacterium]
MTRRSFRAFAPAALGLALAAGAPPLRAQAAADLVLTGGKVWTGNPRQPEAEAVACRHGRVVAVGSAEEVRALAGPGTRVVELKGERVVPGFHDSHVHFLSGGRLLSQVNLKDAENEEEFGKRLRAFDAKLPRDRWLVGGNWDHDRTFGGELPTAELLDKYVPDRPAFLRRYDGHMALVNSRALQLAGITAATPDPPGGVIYRKADGKTPSGILKD